MKKASTDISSAAAPFTIWDDLAQSNTLIEYVRRFKGSNLTKSKELQATVLDSIYNYSTEITPEVEIFYCNQYHSILTNFLERTSRCRQRLAAQLALR